MSEFETSFDEPSVDEHEGEVSAAPASGLAALRAQRAKIKESLHLDLKVPRYEDPAVYVRYRPMNAGQMKRILEKAKSSKHPDAVALANATILAECTVGVFELDAKGKPIGEPDQWLQFGPELAEYLGEPELKRAADVVRSLFFTDGDIIATAGRLTEWSGFAKAEAVEEYEGN